MQNRMAVTQTHIYRHEIRDALHLRFPYHPSTPWLWTIRQRDFLLRATPVMYTRIIIIVGFEFVYVFCVCVSGIWWCFILIYALGDHRGVRTQHPCGDKDGTKSDDSLLLPQRKKDIKKIFEDVPCRNVVVGFQLTIRFRSGFVRDSPNEDSSWKSRRIPIWNWSPL